MFNLKSKVTNLLYNKLEKYIALIDPRTAGLTYPKPCQSKPRHCEYWQLDCSNYQKSVSWLNLPDYSAEFIYDSYHFDFYILLKKDFEEDTRIYYDEYIVIDNNEVIIFRTIQELKEYYII